MSADPLLADQVVPLLGVAMEPRRVMLETNIALTRARARDRRAFADWYSGGWGPSPDWLNAWDAVCSRRCATRPGTVIAIGADGNAFPLDILVPAQEDWDLGPDVATVLRLLKPGKMWCITDAYVVQAQQPLGSNWQAYPQFSSRGSYEHGGYTLTSNDVPQLKRLWTLYRDRRHRDSQALSQALDRFNRAYSLRPIDVAERVAELVMGLEALFLYEADELSYRLGLRCACLLSSDPVERTRICSELRSAYLVRSRFVHGAAAPEKVKVLEGRMTLEELAARLEHTLRSTIRLFLVLLDTLDEKTLKRHLLDEHILAGSKSSLAHILSRPSARWLLHPRPASPPHATSPFHLSPSPTTPGKGSAHIGYN